MFAITFLLSLAVITPVLAQEPLRDLPVLPPPLGSILDQTDPRSGKPMMAPLVSKPVEPEELRDYALVLQLSEEQRKFAHGAYLAYRERTDKLYEKHHDPVMELSYAAADTEAHPYDWEYLRLMTALRETESEFQRDLVEQDKAFLSNLQTVLSEAQQERFERVTLRRSRKRCQPYNINISPGYIDLVDMVQEYIKAEEILNDLHPLLLEYERLITPQYISIDATSRRRDLSQVRHLVESQYAADGKTRIEPGSPEAIARAPEERKNRVALLAETIPEQERLADINREYIVKLAAVVPEAEFGSLKQEFMRQAFPYIHPDPCDPKSILQSMVDTPEIDPELRDLMQARVGEWRAAYDRMTRDMEEHYEKYNGHFARTFSSEGVHTPAIRSLRLERLTCSEETVKSVHALLPAEVNATFERKVTAFLFRLASEREQETNPHRGNP